MADPFSVAGSAVGVISLGISVCQGLVKYYSAFKGRDDEVGKMVGKVERLTGLLEALQHRLSSPRYRHSVSVEKVEQNIVACATSLTKLKDTLSKCTQESTADDLRHKLRTTSRRMLYPFKQKTLQDLSAAVSKCQGDLETAMQILQIDQLSTVDSSNAVLLGNTEITRDIIEVTSHEIRAMREDIQRLMEVAVPALVLSSMRPQLQGNGENTATTALDTSSASLEPKPSEWRTIMSPESYISLCRCRARTKFIERQLRLGPVTLIRTSKSRIEHNEDCRYFGPGGHDEGAGLKLQVGTRSRRWNITTALNYNHAVGAFSINPTFIFKATVPDDHPLFIVTKDIVRGKRRFEAGLQSIRLLFQNGEAAPNVVDVYGANALQDKITLRYVSRGMNDDITIDEAFQERVRQLIMAFLALGVNVNELYGQLHILDVYLEMLLRFSDRSNAFSFLTDLREKTAMHRDCVHNPGNLVKLSKGLFFYRYDSYHIIEIVKKDEHLGNEFGFNDLCLAVLRKSLDDVNSILSESPSAISHRTAGKHTVLHLAADWPTGMETLLSRGGKSLVHKLDVDNHSPLEHACHYSCASVVKLLLQAKAGIDLNLMGYLERRSNWELFQIFLEELSRRRSALRQLAEIELCADKYRDLEISVEYPMNDIKTALVLNELEENFSQIPGALDYYGHTELSSINSFFNIFGTRFGNTTKGAEMLHNTGFLLELDIPIFRFFQIRGKSFLVCQELWTWKSTLAQRLGKMLWLLERGFTFFEYQVHNLFRRSIGEPFLEAESEDLIASEGERTELLAQLLSSRSGMQHTCPCCIDVCFPAVTALRPDKESPCREIRDPEGGKFIFADLLGMVEACKSRLGPEFWVWAMPSLIHSVLYEACCLTHSLGCCKNDLRVCEEEFKERQEEEEYMRSRLSTLTEELTAEYGESSMLLSDFLRDRVVVRALELIDGEEEASPEDRKRLREIGVVLEEEIERESDGDQIANDDRMW